MRKFFAVVKREYIQRVRTKFFVIATILGPLMMAAFTIVPAMMFGIKSGGPTRLAIVDQTGKMYERVAKEIVSRKSSRTESATEAEPAQPAVGPNNSSEQINRAGKLMKSKKIWRQGLRAGNLRAMWCCHRISSRMDSLNSALAIRRIFSPKRISKAPSAGRFGVSVWSKLESTKRL